MTRRRRWSGPSGVHDFTTPAIITMVLYFVLYIPGLIANLAYISAAQKEAERTGEASTGVGCLWSLLFVFVGAPVLILTVVFIGTVTR